MDIHSLKKGSQYTVQQDFADFYRNQFKQGELLTLTELHFLTYHGEYTVVCREQTLQEEENSNVLGSLGDYLQSSKEMEDYHLHSNNKVTVL